VIAGRGDVVRTLSIAGETVRREHVHRLAAMLGGDVLGAKFERALDNDNTIVALTSDDRTRLLEVLAPGLPGLGGLRETLLKQRERSNASASTGSCVRRAATAKALEAQAGGHMDPPACAQPGTSGRAYLTSTQPYMSNSAKCGAKLQRTR
jgi:hypothetical protein